MIVYNKTKFLTIHVTTEHEVGPKQLETIIPHHIQSLRLLIHLLV